tara:strand:- start:162 stop:281 length:120 start_codon:yes stop_codon:yes gene_type:complete
MQKYVPNEAKAPYSKNEMSFFTSFKNLGSLVKNLSKDKY